MNKLLAGLIDTTLSTVERGFLKAFEEDVTFSEWLAYTFDPGTIAFDFVAGVTIDCVMDGITDFFKGRRASRGQYSFDMNGNEVACLSDFYEVGNLADIENARFFNEPMFYGVQVDDARSVYVSTGNIRQSQFADIVNESSGNISIVSGMHGAPDGTLLSEFNGISGSQLLNEDIRVWGNSSNVKIYDLSSLSAEELKSVINASDITICGWCFSERTELLLEALGCK